MAIAGADCLACHALKSFDSAGYEVLDSTGVSCMICHKDTNYDELVNQWIEQLDSDLAELEELQASISDILQSASSKVDNIDKLAQMYNEASKNINMVKKGKGIHNKNYATDLLDAAFDRLEYISKVLELDNEKD